MKYIPAEKLKAELTKLQFSLNAAYRKPQADNIVRAISLEYDDIISLITFLQQEPRFPQYDNIVDKVFGAGNLEGFEYREAEMLVALAKEELLKSLQQEQPEVDLDNLTIMKEIKKCGRNPNEFDIARHFWNKGYNARKEE